MALEIKLQLKQMQKLVMTTELRNAIKLLTLSRLELQQLVQQKLLENPFLEEVNDETEDELDEQDTSLAGENQKEDPVSVSKKEEEIDFRKKAEEINWEDFTQAYQDNYETNLSSDYQDKSPQYENILASKVTLSEYLTNQLRLVWSSKEEFEAGCFLIGNLDENGYLATPLSELIEQHHLDSSVVYKAHELLKNLEPEGIGSQNLQECLLAQVKHQGITDPLITKIISNHLPELELSNFKAVADKCNVAEKEVLEALKFIKTLDPKPARNFGGDEIKYIIPDIFVVKVDDKYVVYLNDDGFNNFRINPFYREFLHKKNSDNNATKTYLEQKFRSALWLLKTMRHRQQTIYKVSVSIVNRQKEFFDHGISHLKPMVLREIAKDISLHECTVSRVTSNKYMHTPQGLFELKFFFTSGLTGTEGSRYSCITVKNMIKEIITKENKEKPFSDKRIVQILEGQNLKLARRTIAKYREDLGILPSARRKELV
ncbi:MAG: RNA polymerase sigma-54 factor [Candidatus Schekmanbacteria bacterium RIFCSPHIGHO2_02_FULL_38_11]|uniref:RNA polymerase sigma-54 factor n=1 Tax=Candidatus Schekmanbacteria bacterium RIFCSPLOWO2_12_FULL_38_15 TaxID=1817883 RepID=A0A1F7SMS7_9BACT|nr:MAG: RNA polymerase sigma-54 factor [Candidatus Schekmanbacteria bacterium GWA2_38_9]OGL48695.1 MAG: RNA polymerase sigma-54 factor [Candidatus Schekmanbacteria bacterium RIFCSPHIGHO2_02_FULL_38_11]OGL51081.1 MAG: RNA polymerase sigma-54 factor [Candidatus Schekmanbacteria bacterium RIFCSPLOWO2_02_FULL_38_14]OGL55081.1 MAG: RNA polymerase sigma-54 factor [Candidatus Schekmanbacteria bacterium RIFCSPLOWO2_12_FULL_38_15]